MREMGKGLCTSPFLASAIFGTQLLKAAASKEQKAAIASRLVAGTALLAVAHAEPGSRYRTTRVETAATADGDGMVDAACQAIKRATGLDGVLTDYTVTSVTGGVDALADVALRFESGGTSMPGRGLSTDVVEASARAFLNAMNRIVRIRDTGEDPASVERPGSLRQL